MAAGQRATGGGYSDTIAASLAPSIQDPKAPIRFRQRVLAPHRELESASIRWPDTGPQIVDAGLERHSSIQCD